ncbi:MAG: YtxH domain-containing protein [Anaerolineae bacterium]|nr:YtxH domain-containing protein [Anaerolineae bacterium]
MRRFTSFLAGAICGALVGAVAALLMAPYAGPELRERMNIQVQGLVDKGREAATAKRAELEAQLEAFKQGKAATPKSGDAAAG